MKMIQQRAEDQIGLILIKARAKGLFCYNIGAYRPGR